MKVNEKLITEISSEVKLAFTEQETTDLVAELNDILQMVSSLSEVDTEGVVGTFYGGLGEASFRKDEPIANPKQVELMLEQAKASYDGLIEVPAILDDGEAGA